MKKILIVDDHADIRKLIRMTLEFEDFEVKEASTGNTALQLVHEWQPDLVLMDVMMPGSLSGLEVCARLKSDPALADLRIILLSARGQARDREAGMRAGADAYMVKPFSPLQLIDGIAGMWAPA